MTEDRSDAVRLCALGALSGAVAWGLMTLTDSAGMSFEWNVFYEVIKLSPFSLFPGLVFGLIIGNVLQRRRKSERLLRLRYLIAAGLGYFCAFHVAYYAAQYIHDALNGSDLISIVFAGIFGGVAGSFLLGAITTRLLNVPARLLLRVPVGVGGAAGALLGLTAHDNSKWGWTFLIFFMLWQGAYATSLAPLLRARPDRAQ